jgi:Mrp family chromosome partitioning ATPase
MSRMFRVISGSGHEIDRDTDSRIAEMFDPFGGEAIPFVEVGGPDGVVTSTNRAVPPQPIYRPPVVHAPPEVSVPVSKPRIVPAAPSVIPMSKQVQTPDPVIAEPSKILSVTFHRIPKMGLRMLHTGIAPEVVMYHFPDHPVTGEYRQVRDEIVKQFDEPGPKVTLFTAASSSAGTTTVLVNFAVAMTQEYGSRVLVVDANFNRPGAARLLGGAESPGLAEVLGQSIPLSWALQPTPVTNLHLLPAGTPTDATEESLATDFPKLLGQLRQWFDWVVVDAGVWSDLPNAEAACAKTDAVFLVTRSGDLELPGFGGLRGEVTSNGGHVRGYISTRQ